MKKLKEVTDKKKTSLLKNIDEKLTEAARELGFRRCSASDPWGDSLGDSHSLSLFLNKKGKPLVPPSQCGLGENI